MKNKTQLLAELTLMQEAAQNARKHCSNVVYFQTECIADFAESAKAALEEGYDRTAKILGDFAQRLKVHWKNSPSLFNTIDKELAQAIAELKKVEAKPPLEKEHFRVTIEDGADGSVSVVDTHALKFFYLNIEIDGNPSLKSFMHNGSDLDQCLFYIAMQEHCKKMNKLTFDKFEKIYQDYMKEFGLEEIVKGEE